MSEQHTSAGPGIHQSSTVAAEIAGQTPSVALLTGGSDRSYVFGLTMSLLSTGTVLDVIACDELDFPQFHNRPGLTFLKLRGDQRHDVRLMEKARRILSYYGKLIAYAATARPRLFHILWNSRFESFDRTVLMLYYKLLGKKVVLTAHNVNADKRDGKDTVINRMTLRMQYRLTDHVFVHTEKMKEELTDEFGVPDSRVSVIPFGINNSVSNTNLTCHEAKNRLGISREDRAVLFFGRITPYKGLEYLIAAFRKISTVAERYRLIIAGRVDRCDAYWATIRNSIQNEISDGTILLRDEYIPDDDTEVYFKAADVAVLPYRNIYQSGVLFLAHSFGLPVIAADVGSLTDDIVEGENGFAFKPENSEDLARVIRQYFVSDLYKKLASRRHQIRDEATRRHSWDVVGAKTVRVYANLLQLAVGPATQTVATVSPTEGAGGRASE